MKVAIFGNQKFEVDFLLQANARFHHDLVFFKEGLHAGTASMVKGFPAVSTFPADDLDADTLAALAEGGTRLIALRSAGYNNVDLDAARKVGISVMRVPAYAPSAIAEHAVALMLTLNRHIHKAYNRVREGNFDLNGLVGFNMTGKTVGIVGTGKIGTALARIMKGFGCEMLAYDVYRQPDCIELGVRYVDFAELMSKSDIVSLHCPLTAQTRHLVNGKMLGLMKPGSMLINTARGGVVDTAAVIDSLKSASGLEYFGMDVYEEEGGLFFSDRSLTIIKDDAFERLTTMPNVVITGHQAFLTREALTEIAEITLENISSFEAGRPKQENLISA
ncbi:2-hydroxyacid dehydrogenase [Bradyrhizobium sp. dw_78]|uniref:2-hydroxyacid dehydrogenase n=1 Tax=Bradyrhizobium sp. dw_78 TaxID=2719793 RepID=UPI001BD3C1C3|nr:2-hydroxyacid dehydrogenase [Bradyrhizobium sp. dw_78]